MTAVLRAWHAGDEAAYRQDEWFSEGFDTADLKDAAALLERLGANVRTRRLVL